jgi:SAM-dependent methyltransferase
VFGRTTARAREFWTRTGQRTRLTAALEPLIAGLGGTVLDVGGGRQAGHDDVWPPTTRHIRLDVSGVHGPDVQATATRLPLPDAVVDAVVMIELLEHVSDPADAIDEAWRVLRRGGKIIGSVPFVAPVHGDPSDFYRYSEHGIRHLLRRFEDVRVRALGNHYGAAWAILAARSRAMRILNPLMRQLGRTPDRRCPQGYLFEATR